ncbi:MAG: hypothetical protein H6Q42_874, partial [Deltaproteobacteria bacterium]|nr:hypothetical protein [Deltaproteobacteria bacterium]
AANGEEALGRLERKDIDLLLLDILLPGTDGFEICRRLKTGADTRKIQVLFITCLADLENRARGFENGADDFLVKPIDQYELIIRVNKLLQKKLHLDRLQHTYEINFYEGVLEPITGLYNRAYLQNFLNFEMKRSLRQKCPLALLMYSIEDFGKIAASQGQQAAERILREVGHSLKMNFREIDLTVHCGEEIFAVVLPYTDGPGAVKGAERVRKIIQALSFSQETARPPLKINLRMGISLYSNPEWGVNEFIQQAREALYQAQKAENPCFLMAGWMKIGN